MTAQNVITRKQILGGADECGSQLLGQEHTRKFVLQTKWKIFSTPLLYI